MKRFVQRLDDDSEVALCRLAASMVQFICAPSSSMTRGKSSIVLPNASIQIGPKEFVIIENDWSDTPEEWHDYYFLQARIADRPKDVPVKESPIGDGWTYSFDHFSFCLGPQSSVSKLEILSGRASGDLESVDYDAGILLTQQSGQQICVVREESITGLLVLIHNSEEISSMIEGLHRREVKQNVG